MREMCLKTKIAQR